MFLSKKFSKAFTLLEILVVLGIVAIMLGLAVVSYSSAQKKARDDQRKQTLKAVQNALEQYYVVCNGNYILEWGDANNAGPAGMTAVPPCNTIAGGNTPPWFYMPNDPLGSQYQAYDYSTKGYMICPPDSVNGGKRLETEDCSDKSCCVHNLQ